MRNMQLRSAVDSLKVHATDAIKTLAAAIADINKHLDTSSTDLQTALGRLKRMEDRLDSLEHEVRNAKT